ncbi:ER-golgi trafficking TRAPP I complex 85 kDa subunit-domain-containing protein [Hysterangium stoloniferum]|nr:ER-golgi trafficking TRAPP I complex 85 kDa subunit-domain-containing protein [Hysterangium stoloniferum]
MSTSPNLPLSISPHVCVFPSADLTELLSSCSLPTLHRLLQLFSPLRHVTTRTTTLTTVTHASFSLRFSDFNDVNTACKEDEDSRAGRTIDWIGQRVAKRAAAWVEEAEGTDHANDNKALPPWWRELQRCTEGDHTPSKHEGWNHPVAVILAVSTLAPNPLQAVTELHSKYNEVHLPSWVDPTRLRHTLIIHPTNSPLNSDEAMALFNATKKQFGLHTHLLAVSFSPPASPLAVPSFLPELPATPLPDAAFSKALPEGTQHLNLTEEDMAQFAHFVREFVTMSLIPWLERCVLDWNEAYTSTRRLPSRLFSSTRKLFGGSISTPTSLPSYSNSSYANSSSSPTSPAFGAAPPSQQRRLAEFATFLGDLKLAVSVWESLRKDGRGGSEVLPLLLAPSPAVGAHANYALSTLQTSAGPSSQLRALAYAVRWGTGVQSLEDLEGDRWLVAAAGSVEEPPPALLLAHAALISDRKGAKRRAAMWYFFAGQRLEKCGIKPLTVYFLRKAHERYHARPSKNLSPSFDEVTARKEMQWFDAILPSIEYSLGRLMYTSGDTEGALRYFLGLLKGSPFSSQNEQDLSLIHALYVGDFKVAYEHMKTIVGGNALPTDLKPQFSLSHPAETKIRLSHQGESDSSNGIWDTFEQTWSQFWKTKGNERIEKTGRASVGERFFIEIVLKNPLNIEVTLTNVTVKVITAPDNNVAVDVETVDNILLEAKETRIVTISVISHNAATLKFTHLTYYFLSLLPVSESLAVRGARLQDTAAQRQGVVYGTDVIPTMCVDEGGRRLECSLSNSEGGFGAFTLSAGECADFRLNLRNTGSGSIDDIWIIHSPSVWLDLEPHGSSPVPSPDLTEVLRSNNSLASALPLSVPLAKLHSATVLASNDSIDLPLTLHAEQSSSSQEFAVLLIYREHNQTSFFSSKLYHVFDVVPILEIGASVRPSANSDISYTINLEIQNVDAASEVRISQVTTASADWRSTPLNFTPFNLPSRQTGRVFLNAQRWTEGSGSLESKQFVIRQLSAVLNGEQPEPLEPPLLDVIFSHIAEPGDRISACDSCNQQLLESSKRIFIWNSLLDQFPQLPPSSLPHLFPLRNPQSMDIIVWWDLPSQRRCGYVTIPSLLLGANHGPLDELILQSETAKVKRTMYAETAKEKTQVQDALRVSDWNANMNPAVVRVTSSPRVEHDFLKGDLTVPVTFTIRNFSLTNHIRFVLRLQPVDYFQYSEAQILPSSYVGKLTRRGELTPMSTAIVEAKMWVSRPGIYGLSGWRLETEVGEREVDPWCTRASFSQGQLSGEESIVIVVQAP